MSLELGSRGSVDGALGGCMLERGDAASGPAGAAEGEAKPHANRFLYLRVA